MSIPINFPYLRGKTVNLFDYFASITIGANSTGVPITFTIPQQSQVSYLTLFGQGIDNANAWITTVWQIRVNGTPQQYYDKIQDQLAEFVDPKEIAPVTCRSGDVVDVFVQNNDGAAAHLFGARLRGFHNYGF